MSDLAGGRPTIQLEETQFRGPVSESLAQRLGSSVNMANKIYETHRWSVQGAQSEFADLSLIAVDGVRMFLKPQQIIGVGIWAFFSGTSGGPLDFTIKRHTTSGFNIAGGVEIFSTTPQWTPGFVFPGNDCWMYDLIDGSSVKLPTGTVNAPILDVDDGTIEAGEWLTLDILDLPANIYNLNFQLFTRVR